MVSIDEMETLLNEILSDFPQDLFRDLNGGVVLLPQAKPNPLGRSGDLYTLGEYRAGGGLGRYIALFYGSFARVFGSLDREGLKRQLTHTLKHEFTHHLESLAGEQDLIREDARFLAEYLHKRGS